MPSNILERQWGTDWSSYLQSKWDIDRSASHNQSEVQTGPVIYKVSYRLVQLFTK